MGEATFTAATRLEAGDQAPPFVLRDAAGQEVALYADALGGRAVVLALAGADGGETQALHGALAALAADDAAVPVLIVAAAAAPEAGSPRPASLADPAGRTRAAYGVAPGAPAPVLLIDANRRVVLIARDGAPAARVAAAAEAARRLARARPAARLGEHPPVLVLPRLLDRTDCARLIEVWHRPVQRWESDGFNSDGFAGERGDFKLRVESYGRTDQFVVRDPAVLEHLDSRLPRRVLPQITKAFGRRVDGREEYRIACYDSAEGGSLPAHRDNPTPATRHRVFTLSVHLNPGEYDGGGLRFPEYGDQVYEVEAGTGIVWSCSLLHEVLPVTRGRRFILGTHYCSGPPQGAPATR